MAEWSNELIMELVAKIDEPKDILERHGCTPSQLKMWMKDPRFVNQFKEARTFWDSNTNMRGRIEQKALAALEDSLVSLFSLANSADTNPTARLDAVAKIAKLAKADGGEARADIKGGPGGPSVMISINLGDQTVQKEITTDMVVRDDQEIILGELSQLGETK